MCLATGEVTSYAISDEGRPRKTRLDVDGYESVPLFRKVSGRVKRSRRLYMKAFVHRLVMVKAIAMQHGGDAWREYVDDLPGDIDVDHKDNDRTNNALDNLRLRSWYPHRSRQVMEDEERAEMARFLNLDPETDEVPF